MNVSDLIFIKSTYSPAKHNCVELAALPGGGAAMRDSKNPDSGILNFTAGEMRAFLDGAKAGEFDHLA